MPYTANLGAYQGRVVLIVHYKLMIWLLYCVCAFSSTNIPE